MRLQSSLADPIHIRSPAQRACTCRALTARALHKCSVCASARRSSLEWHEQRCGVIVRYVLDRDIRAHWDACALSRVVTPRKIRCSLPRLHYDGTRSARSCARGRVAQAPIRARQIAVRDTYTNTFARARLALRRVLRVQLPSLIPAASRGAACRKWFSAWLPRLLLEHLLFILFSIWWLHHVQTYITI